MKEFPWRLESPRRPPRAPLNRDEIVRAGLRMVKTEGIDGVSMRRLAAEFGTGPSSLYAHVVNKDELLRLMFDEMCGQVAVPEPDPANWRGQLREIARSAHRVMLEHNDLSRYALATIPTGPNALRISETMLSLAIGGGIRPQPAAWAMDRIFLYVTSDAYETSIWNLQMAADGTSVREVTADLGAWFAELPPDRFPHLRAYAREMTSGDGDERFEFGLDLLIDGLERYRT